MGTQNHHKEYLSNHSLSVTGTATASPGSEIKVNHFAITGEEAIIMCAYDMHVCIRDISKSHNPGVRTVARIYYEAL